MERKTNVITQSAKPVFPKKCELTNKPCRFNFSCGTPHERMFLGHIIDKSLMCPVAKKCLVKALDSFNTRRLRLAKHIPVPKLMVGDEKTALLVLETPKIIAGQYMNVKESLITIKGGVVDMENLNSRLYGGHMGRFFDGEFD